MTRGYGPPEAARDAEWLAEYRQHRPMVERTIAWLTRGNRRVRYRGVTKNDHWLHPEPHPPQSLPPPTDCNA